MYCRRYCWGQAGRCEHLPPSPPGGGGCRVLKLLLLPGAGGGPARNQTYEIEDFVFNEDTSSCNFRLYLLSYG